MHLGVHSISVSKCISKHSRSHPPSTSSQSEVGCTEKQHQQRTFRSGRNGSGRVDALRQSCQRYPGGRLLRARRQYHASHSISPCDRRFAISSRSVGLLCQTNTLALWPTVTIRRNGFIGYILASGLQCTPRCRKTSSHYTEGLQCTPRNTKPPSHYTK